MTHYDALDGLRGLSCAGIIMMHLWANGNYSLPGGFFVARILSSFADLVFPLMAIAAFGLCCGYREKMLAGQVPLAAFYGRRIRRWLPLFGAVVLAEFLSAPSRAAAYEAFADLTLFYGFLAAPGELQMVGVGWFLGLLVVFVLCFPFFCVLLETKRRAWCAFAVSLAWNAACIRYFSMARTSILYSGCFFMVGGLVYLYREKLSALPRCLRGIGAGGAVFFYALFNGGTLPCLMVSAALLALALPGGSRFLAREIPVRLGRSSLELYLLHMAFFRVLERLHLLYPFGRGIASYFAVLTVILLGAVGVSALRTIEERGICP